MRRTIKEVASNPQSYKKCIMCGAINLLENKQCVNCGSRFALKDESNVGMSLQVTEEEISRLRDRSSNTEIDV